MQGQNQGPIKPKGELPIEKAVEQDLESVERERSAQETVRQTGREGDIPATGVVSDRGDKPV